MLEIDFDRIRSDLDLLRKARGKIKVFGAEAHGFQMNAPLPEATVHQFEQQNGIALPSDYREFLIRIGNGGAGPYYGVFKLGEMDKGWEQASWKECSDFVGCLSKPFPHTQEWNDLNGRPDCDEGDEAEYEKQLAAFEQRYFNSEIVNGAIPICHTGCAIRHWLVVTGVEAGNMWCDGRANDSGLYPLQQEGIPRFTFYAWYRRWLDEALGKLPSA